MSLNLLVSAYIFILGLLVGSFLNVCIYRIPRDEDFMVSRSHCTSCGYILKWYDLIPIFSWIALKGKCRKCKCSISIQYLAVEILNAFLWVITFQLNGYSLSTALLCSVISALVVLSFIDFETYEIPLGINLFIVVIAIAHLFSDLKNIGLYAIGTVFISGILLIIFWASKGRAIGGGDVKLMAAAGLLLGYKLVIIAFLFGCFYGVVIHSIRMKVSNEGSMLALGPYLSMGIVTAIWFGNNLIDWYFTTWIY